MKNTKTKSDLYLDSGFLNFDYIMRYGTTFNFIIGGRGIGKTYGALKYIVENDKRFFFMRRTQSQIDTIAIPEFSPFKSLNFDFGWNIGMYQNGRYMKAVYNCELGDEGKLVPSGPPIGIASALSVISNLRGFDASDIEIIVFDEFIPERHERLIKDEASAFLNAYETINRNRELKGQSPVKVLALSNSNNIAAILFAELNLINIINKMIISHREEYHDMSRDLSIYNIQHSPISKKKKATAIYKLSGEKTNFYKMSINNDYAQERYDIRGRKLIEYRPLVNCGEVCVYKHKSNGSYYVSFTRNDTVETYGSTDLEKMKFRTAFNTLWMAFMRDRIEFESPAAAEFFKSIWV